MKRLLLLTTFVLAVFPSALAQRWAFKGTVVKMEMTECIAQHGFMAAMSGTTPAPSSNCPEFTVLSDKVVYVVVGKHSEQFMPLAEEVIFQLRKNELLVFSDDEKEQARFAIRRMVLRADWEREEERKDAMLKMADRTVGYEGRTLPRGTVFHAASR